MEQIHEVLHVHGGIKLAGHVTPSGSKNAAFPILAATLLSDAPSTIHRVPDILDIRASLEILAALGMDVRRAGAELGTYRIVQSGVLEPRVPLELGSKIRGSYYFLGALLARTGAAFIPVPGGCNIGDRPFDLHLEAMKLLGADVGETPLGIEARCRRLRGTRIQLPFASRGATGNVLLAATTAQGTTVLENANASPEILSLGRMLAAMGAKIKGLGTPVVSIEGVSSLNSAEFSVPADKVEAGTLLLAGLMTRGQVEVTEVDITDLDALLHCLSTMNVPIATSSNSVAVHWSPTMRGVSVMSGLPPKIDPDFEPLLAALLGLLSGSHTISDPINQDRHQNYLPQLMKMGASVEVVDRTTARIRGVEQYHPRRDLVGNDIRSACALVLASLATNGHSVIDGLPSLDRGYERLDEKLGTLGAMVERRASKLPST